MPIKPTDAKMYSKHVDGGVYEAIIIAAKRARQIHNDVRLELNQRLETLAQLTMTVDSEDEMDISANPDQLKISLEFEQRSKTTELAMRELASDQLEWRKREEEKPEEAKEDSDVA